MIDPIMGTMNSIADALFTKSQQRVLATLFGHPERSFYANEIVRIAGTGSGAVQRVLRSLEHSGLITSRLLGNQKHYQANAESPVFGELCSLVVKTFGVTDALRATLVPLQAQIAFACVYGSTAKGGQHVASDVDLLLVSDSLVLEALLDALSSAEKIVGRKINSTLYTRAEFRRHRVTAGSFLNKVLAGERVVLMGSPDVAA